MCARLITGQPLCKMPIVAHRSSGAEYQLVRKMVQTTQKKRGVFGVFPTLTEKWAIHHAFAFHFAEGSVKTGPFRPFGAFTGKLV